MTSTFTLCGRHGTWHPPSLCVVGVALRDIHLHFAWQAWRFVTSSFTLCPILCVVGVALRDIHPPSLCVAGVALCDIHLHFVWQAWHLTTSTVTLRGRRGTYGTGLALAARLVIRWRRGAAAFCVAGVTLRDIHLHFAVDFGRLLLPVHCRPLPRAGSVSGRWHGCCSAGGSPRYAASACPAPWSLSRCAVAVSLHLPGEWLPADNGMSTPDALSACQPSWSCRRTWSPEQESVPLPDEQRLPSRAIGYVAGGCPAWLDFGGWRGSQLRQMLGGLQWRAAPRRGSSAAGQHVHLGNALQALRGLPIVWPGCHRRA